MYHYKYVAVLDIDEIIVPMGNITSWSKMIHFLEEETANQTKSSYVFRNIYFLDEFLDKKGLDDELKAIPKELHTLRHIYRSVVYNPENGQAKSIHNTDLVKIVHNHEAMQCLSTCNSHLVDPSTARLQHYRKEVGQIDQFDAEVSLQYNKDCVKDTSHWRFKDELITRVGQAIHDINLS